METTSHTNTKFNEALYATISFFDLVEYPLTLLEVHRWLWNMKADTREVYQALHKHPELECTNGFYHLKNKKQHVELRLLRYSITEQKLKKLKPFLRLIATLPYVKTIMLSDSIGIYNAKESSDIDISIITSPQKIWSTRFWAAMPAQILGLRPKILQTGEVYKKDKICLCFYTTTDHLNLEKERITQPDIDFIYWISSMFPIYNVENAYESFFQANSWIQKYLPNMQPYQSSTTRMVKKYPKFISSTIQALSFENALRKIQKIIMNDALRELADQHDTRVIISDSLLKLHTHDKRLQTQKQWQNKIHSTKPETIKQS